MADAKRFFELIDHYNTSDVAGQAETEAVILGQFRQDKAVLALDMSGFTDLVQRFGVVHYVAIIRRMNLIAGQVIETNKGAIAKTDADNLTAVFGSVSHAVEAADQLFQAFEDDNQGKPSTRHIRASVGIAYGDILAVPGYDVNGDAVNLSYKLGEDLAEVGEILLDQSAYRCLSKPEQAAYSARQYDVSGVTINAWLKPSMFEVSALGTD